MDGNTAAAVGSVCGVIIVFLQMVNNYLTLRMSQKMTRSDVVRDSNSIKLDNMSTKLDHVHTCVEQKADEIKAVVASPSVGTSGSLDVVGTLEVRPKEG